MSPVSWFRKPVIGYFLRTFMALLQGLAGLLIKKNHSIFIAAPQGFRFADNSSFLFRYLYENEVNCFYTVNRKEDYIHLSKTYGYHILYAYSYRAFIQFVKSKCLVYAYADWDFHPFQVSGNKLVINLWHSISIKKLGLAAGLSKIHALKLKKEMQLIDAFVASSKKEADSLYDCFGLSSEKILVSGTPRNDYLLNKQPNDDLVTRNPELAKRTILYCPTFRNNGITNLLPFNDFDLKELDAFLAANDTNLLVRKHHREWYYQKAMGYDELAECTHIFKAGQSEFEEVQELLPHVDILMTDYSGIYFDFLLLDRPMVFAPYDMDQFCVKPGFLFDYEKNTPGAKVYDTAQFKVELSNIFSGIDKYSNERESIRDQFHLYQDGKSSQRILDYIQSHKKFN
ncbi:CDP-glycerol:poly(glycerophosphate) glycerophosphotransferase [Reichenbachiella faecimaris]|uniref:CDP-glycerol:poly(Glycerophosphate) glycerophosphotransferase n=1 Tax=Reichenbachiella faecimaris TaxID=692418 RepID=A0A1W2G7T3_REIFA|nr:CDP-glycerol glycerophosphotransferase family protein [Reichenbachiella faecimaris]SMD32388.1 CDP-glycerol:poly(glycerophosphate) glycerophosphotransferase [Reichenbachiella faecimaris]